jgi:glycosyltransferase involved in cell wall biosynthesis
MAPAGVRKHIINVIKGLVNHGVEINMYIPLIEIMLFDREYNEQIIKELENLKINIYENTYTMIQKYSGKLSRFKYFFKSHMGLGDDKKFAEDFAIKYKSDIVYDMHEDSITLKISYLIAKILNKPLIKLFHDEPFRYSLGRGYRKFWGLKGLSYDVLMGFFYYLDREVFQKAASEGILRGVAAVSEAPLYLSKFRNFEKKFNLKIKVYNPGNGINENIINFRTKRKKDYAIFYSRLVPQKGIRDLVKIAKLVNGEILVFGRFFDSSEEKYFLKSIPKNVRYIGFVGEEVLYKNIAEAKVLIYPSHQDGFSLSVLESIALMTPVVAYDIPAIRFVYGNLRAVKIVREFDYNSMATEINKFLSTPEYEIFNLFDKNIENFIKKHTWENVVKETLDYLKSFVR